MVDWEELGFGGKADSGIEAASEVVLADTTTSLVLDTFYSLKYATISC